VSVVVVDIVSPTAAGGLRQQSDDVPLAAQLVAEPTRVGEEERQPDQGRHVQDDPAPDGGLPHSIRASVGAAAARALGQLARLPATLHARHHDLGTEKARGFDCRSGKCVGSLARLENEFSTWAQM
jgi:hypothetical protein